MEFKCSICIDTLFSVNTDVCVTPCGHLFHKVCMDCAMQNNMQCPNCNTGIAEDVVKKYILMFLMSWLAMTVQLKPKTFLKNYITMKRRKGKSC